jgi:dolichyl-diphosphooligosaccharide--protein glycosyltransferase
MRNISTSIRNFIDRIRTSVLIKKQNLFLFIALLILLVLAIAIRLSPLIIDNTLIKAFDPWIQYYNANYLSTHSLYEYFHWVDFKSWFPEGYARDGLRPGLTFAVVIIYNIFNGIGIPVTLYDICFYFPAFMGGASVLASYLLGKEVLDKKCGLIFAFFMAFNVGFMQRTTAGFFDNETVGVFAVLMTFYFFVKTIKTGKIRDAMLGGIFLGFLSLSWGGYDFVFYLLPIICGIIALTRHYSANVLIAYAGIEGTGLLIFSIYTRFNYQSLFSSLDIGGVFFFTIILVIFHLINSKKKTNPKLYSNIISFIKWTLIPAVIVMAVILWINPDILPLGFGGRLQSILSPLLRNQLNLVASVAEHAPSAWSVFYYNTLIPLMLLPLGIFFAFKRSSPVDIFLIVFILTIFYFTSSMIRIILLFAPAASLVGAYGLSNVLKIFGSFYGEGTTVSRKRKRQVKRTVGKVEIGMVYLIVGIMFFSQVAHATNIASRDLAYSQITPGGYFHDWEESLTWMKNNLAGTTVVVSWWDYGYWITSIGNMTTVNDNGTINSTRIGLTGMAFTQTNEIYSAEIFKKLHADYVLVFFGFLYSPFGGDEGKWPWMLRICNDNYQRYKAMGLEKDNWAANSVFDESEYWNQTSQKAEDKWFQSQIVRLMFYGLSTTQYTGTNPQTPLEYYQYQIYNRKDDQGNTWASHIPQNGNYDFKVFKSVFNSTVGMVKIFQMDYTALESSFEIVEPKVYDSGYATFKLRNTGTRDLNISNVKINGQSFDYSMGKGFATNSLESGSEDLVWVDIKSSGKEFKVNDIVNVSVEASSVALEGKSYAFSESTGNIPVKQSLAGDIRINRENSTVIQIDPSRADLFLEVKNVGDTVVVLDKFYADTEDNAFANLEYLEGSPILAPGQTAYVHITNSLVSFYPVRTEHKIGVTTPNDIKDEILMTSNYENYKVTIMSENRIASPEAAIITDATYRDHIPIDISRTHAYTYDNGTTRLQLNIKNAGSIIMGLDSIYLKETGSWTSIAFTPFNINPGQEKTINIIASDYLDLDINDEIGVIVTTNFNGSTKASDIGYIHTISDHSSIQIIEKVDGTAASWITTNETGYALIKNTGSDPILLNKLYINETTELPFDTNVTFIEGQKSLGMQECALVSFKIPGLKVNSSNIVNLNVTTNTTASAIKSLSAIVESTYYNIDINAVNTLIRDSLNLVVSIDNKGLYNVTVDAIYVNGTYIPLSNFSPTNYLIGAGKSITLTMSTVNLESIIGNVNINDKIVILVRTLEGAEDTQTETVLL